MCAGRWWWCSGVWRLGLGLWAPWVGGCWLGAGELADALGKGGAAEICNGVDDDGDGEIDEDLVTAAADIDLSSTLTAWTADTGGGTPIVFDGIGAGCFQMGCTPEQTDCEDREFPVHTVRLTRSFYLMRMEMTQSEFESLTGLSPSDFSGANLPVEQMSWHMSAAAANALSNAERLEECYTCVGSGEDVECEGPTDPYGCGGYRLPTEAEWEYSARCGEGTQYSGSDNVEEVGWTSENSGSTTHVVGTLQRNGCGLYDMSGNVWEWVGDWYGGYDEGFQSDPVGVSGGSYRVRRGGSWYNSAAFARVAYRYVGGPADRSYDLGFRLARTIR